MSMIKLYTIGFTKKSAEKFFSLLCSEESPQHCHRRLIAEYLREKWDNIEIKHLK